MTTESKKTLSSLLIDLGIEPIIVMDEIDQRISHFVANPEFCMEPPAPLTVEYINPARNNRRLRLQNVENYFIMDKEDFEKAKYTTWYLGKDGRIYNPKGLSFEEYVGIQGVRRTEDVEYLNFTRESYNF